jgi:peptidoglycan/LPS O-acetylase OafA/YrhL
MKFNRREGIIPGTAMTSVRIGCLRADRRPSRLYLLDGLRLMAALMVTAYHFVAYDKHPGSWWPNRTRDIFPTVHQVATFGWLGVEVFFLISGFVICMSCWGRTLRDFIVSRIVRLYPAYWFCVLVTSSVLILPGAVGTSGMSLHRVLTNFTMIAKPLGVGYVDGVYWTLWAEIRFYLLFAIVAAVGLTYHRTVVFCSVWMFASVLTPSMDLNFMWLIFQPSYSPFFIGGMVLFLIFKFGPTPASCLLLAASWLLAQHQLVSLVNDAEGSVGHELSWNVSLAIVTAFYAVLLAVALRKLDFLNWRWCTPLGALTYPLYLLHEEIGWNVIARTNQLVPPYMLLATLMAALLVASWLIHRWVERPLQRRMRRWLTTTAPSPDSRPSDLLKQVVSDRPPPRRRGLGRSQLRE